jgi:hypothetical protein
MDDFSNETARWLEQRLDTGSAVELELGVLVAAVSGWTEDEGEIDDLVSGLVETGRVALQIA